MIGSTRFSITRRMFEFISLILFALSVILSGCAESTQNASSTTAGSTQTNAPNQSSIPIIAITAIDYGYEMPGNIDVKAGLVDFAMVNNGTQAHQTQVARLRPGVTPDQVLNEFVTKHDQAAAFSLLTLVGGPDIVAPGYGQEATLNLSAGQYVLLCLVVGSDSVPHVDKGMIHFFTVSTTSAQAVGNSPQSDGEVIMKHNTYELPLIINQARAITLHVTNQDSQPHEMNIVKLANGKGIQDIAAFFQAPSGPPPFEEDGGMAALAPGVTGWLKIHLEPGRYAVCSFIPDQATGKAQLTQGMMAQFTVQ